MSLLSRQDGAGEACSPRDAQDRARRAQSVHPRSSFVAKNYPSFRRQGRRLETLERKYNANPGKCKKVPRESWRSHVDTGGQALWVSPAAPATGKMGAQGKVGPGLVLAIAPILFGPTGACLLSVRAGRGGARQGPPVRRPTGWPERPRDGAARRAQRTSYVSAWRRSFAETRPPPAFPGRHGRKSPLRRQIACSHAAAWRPRRRSRGTRSTCIPAMVRRLHRLRRANRESCGIFTICGICEICGQGVRATSAPSADKEVLRWRSMVPEGPRGTRTRSTWWRSSGTPCVAVIPACRGARRRCRCLDCGQVRIDKEYT